jgi:hypothetical protein
MADNSQVADALRTIAEAADDSIAADDIRTVANAVDSGEVPEAFYFAPNAGDYGHPTESSVYIRKERVEGLNSGIIVPADDVPGDSAPRKWSWQYHERGEDYGRRYTYERIAEAWKQAHE